MSTFWEGDFEREQGEIIEAKVIATNSLGSSESSAYNEFGARIETKPLKMSTPSAQSATTSSGQLTVRVTWDDLTR
jgi:hypothetical protein